MTRRQNKPRSQRNEYSILSAPLAHPGIASRGFFPSQARGYASLLFSLSLLLMSATPESFAAESPARRPKIGLVLSGGGARGAAHVGVLKVLEELHIPIDYIAGTSMGSAVGGLYATGIPANELDTIFRKFDWEAALNDNPPRRERSFRRKQDDQQFLSKFRVGVGKNGFKYPRGVVEGQNFVTELRKLGRITQDLKSFDELPIPYRCTATDLVKGERVILGSGDLAMAIRASVAVAPMFSPVEINGRLLADGGYLRNIPVDVAKDMGADRLIVINIGTPLSKRDGLNSMFDVLSQVGRMGGTQFDRQQIEQLGPKDILIEPDLEGLSFVDFGKVPEMIARGEAAARAIADQLKSFSIPEDQYRAYRASRKASPSFPVVNHVDIRQGAKLSDGVIQPFIRQEMGQPVDPVTLQTDLARIYGLGYYEFVDYHVETSSAGNTLVINAPHRSWGPNYLRFGLNLEDQMDGAGRYQLATRFNMTEMNRMGAELQADARVGQDPDASMEFYQPVFYGKTRLDYLAAYFIAPKISYGRELRFFTNTAGERQAEYNVDSFRSGIDAGRQLANWGEIRGGLRHAESDLNVRTGSIPRYPTGSANADETYSMVRVSFDTVDQVAFSRKGTLGYMEYRNTITPWDSEFDYETADFNGRIAIPFGPRHTVGFGGYLGVNLDNDARLPRIYSLGGFNQLSAFSPYELLGKNRALAQMKYEWNGGVISRMKWYLGLLGEGGGTGDRLTDTVHDRILGSGSAYAGLDTVFGPLIIAYSVGSARHDTAWLVLGSPF
jgi:NTE family protein